jgi:UDP-N-acetylmuramate dehydrogenase
MKILRQQLLAPHSTLRIGGPAEYFCQVTTKAELLEAVAWARKKKLPVRILGNGSNVLISDAGIKGLVIKNLLNKIEILSLNQTPRPPQLAPRFELVEADPLIARLSYQASQYPAVTVKLDSGVYLPRAIFSLIAQGITGLEWFAGIPATVGGASYINLHGADKYWSDYLTAAEILTPDLQWQTVSADYFEYDYDQSRLKTSGDLVVAVNLQLRRGPADRALAIAKYWQAKKSHQPQQSLGCIFQNLDIREQRRLGLPTPSIGYLIDKKLGLKGVKIGSACISAKHAGFIENLGGATAAQVWSLIKLVRTRAKKQLGIDLALEVVPWPA